MPQKKKIKNMKRNPAKQKQKVKVSQNVKVIVGDVRKRKESKRSSAMSRPQKQAPSISLNIMNPYQQLLPQQQKPSVNEKPPTRSSNVILQSLGEQTEKQSDVIRRKTKDLQEFMEGQKIMFDAWKESIKEKETPVSVAKPDKTSKIEKMLKTKKMVMSSINWENLLKNEPKAEAEVEQAVAKQPDVYQFLSPRPSGKEVARQREANASIAKGWLEQARENLRQQKYQQELEHKAEDLSQDALFNAFQELEQEQAQQRAVAEPQVSQQDFEEQLQEPPEEEQMTVVVKSKKKLKKEKRQEEQRKAFEQQLEQRKAEERKAYEGGAGAEDKTPPKPKKRGRPETQIYSPQPDETSKTLLEELSKYSEDDLFKQLKGRKMNKYMKILELRTHERGQSNPINAEQKRVAIVGLVNAYKRDKEFRK